MTPLCGVTHGTSATAIPVSVSFPGFMKSTDPDGDVSGGAMDSTRDFAGTAATVTVGGATERRRTVTPAPETTPAPLTVTVPSYDPAGCAVAVMKTTCV